MRRTALVVLAAGLSLAAAVLGAQAQGAPETPRTRMTAALQQACPAKHFEFAGEYDTTGLIEAWEDAVSPADHQAFGVDHDPLLFDLGSFGRVGFHGDILLKGRAHIRADRWKVNRKLGIPGIS